MDTQDEVIGKRCPDCGHTAVEHMNLDGCGHDYYKRGNLYDYTCSCLKEYKNGTFS